MKKQTKLISLLLIVFMLMFTILPQSVMAVNYGNSFYSIVIPDKYKLSFESEEKDSSYRSYSLSTTSEYTRVHVDAYRSKYLKTPLTEKNLNNSINSIKNVYESGTTKLLSISGQMTKVNGVSGFKITYSTQYNGTGTIYYNHVFCLVSDYTEYSLDITTTNKSFIGSTTEKNIINSFKMKDTVKQSNGIPFTDVSKGAWYYDAVKYAYNKKTIAGFNDYTFGPTSKITRGQLVTILYRMEGSPNVSGAPKFSDVKDSKQYYYKAVKWGTDKKIISGYSNGKFGPADNITREQLAVILRNYAKYKGKNVSASVDLKKYSDFKAISSYALTSMKWAVANGILSGTNGKLNPKGNASRAEVAQVLYNYAKK